MLQLLHDEPINKPLTAAILLLTAVLVAGGGLFHFGSAGAQTWRRNLLFRIAPERMVRMLRRRRVRVDEYFFNTSLLQIRRQMVNCRDCSRQPLCDGVMKCPSRASVDYSFCTNAEALAPFAHEQER